MNLAAIDEQLRYGPGMRVQRLVEASALGLAVLLQDVRLAGITFTLTLLQAISPRLAPFALLTAVAARAPKSHRLGDFYFDLQGSRGACIISTVVQAVGLWLIEASWTKTGWIVLTLPTASFLLSPTVGFCAGCWFYILFRDAFARIGLVRRHPHGSNDVVLDNE